jgi:hypothetical protein
MKNLHEREFQWEFILFFKIISAFFFDENHQQNKYLAGRYSLKDDNVCWKNVGSLWYLA